MKNKDFIQLLLWTNIIVIYGYVMTQRRRIETLEEEVANLKIEPK